MSRTRSRRQFLALLPVLAGAIGALAAPGPALPPATDLRADGRLAKEHKSPIVVLFSLPGCPYCEIVRRSHLAPMLRKAASGVDPIIREIDIDSDAIVIGFSGERTTHGAIARSRGFRAAPVVAFWDGDGVPVAEPLRGMLLPDFYGAYLESAIDTARARLAGRG